MANTPVDSQRWMTYMLARKEGLSITAAADKANISRSVAMRANRGQMQTWQYRKAMEVFKQMHPKDVVPLEKLESPAARALSDFGYFRRRYLGRVTVPWVQHSARLVAELLATPHKEFIVVNQPPGVGKTTFWTVDLPLWLICRNRAVRIMIGSAAQDTAALNVQQIRRELEREQPYEAPDDMKRKGLAVDAEATLIGDFGNFRPPKGEAWTTTRLVVVQVDSLSKSNKEPTVSAFGMDSRFLGNRVDLAVWDDVVDQKSVSTPEKRESVSKWFGQYAETRIEPGGLLVLQGQRLHAEDLYHDRIGVQVGDYGSDDDPFAEPVGIRRKYRHVLFKAHYDEYCKGDHSPRTARPYDPDNPGRGCLLDPRRLLFRNLMEVKDEDRRLFTVTYQQEDADPASVLVPLEWVSGGVDPETKEEYLGCWDRDRVMGTMPRHLSPPWLSMVTADPSPSKFWSIQWWVFHPATEQRFLIDHARKTMGANDFLDLISGTSEYTGLLEDWWKHSKKIGAPISHVIVERNAAQRFLLQYDFVKNWQRTRAVRIVAHDTYSNKSDPQFGVQATLPQQYRFGRVRLPAGDTLSKGRSMALVNEVTRYPEVSTTDCVMAQWFAEFNFPRIRRGMERPDEPPKRSVPSWLAPSRKW